MMFVFEYFTVSYDIAGYDFMGTHLKLFLPPSASQGKSHRVCLLMTLLFYCSSGATMISSQSSRQMSHSSLFKDGATA